MNLRRWIGVAMILASFVIIVATDMSEGVPDSATVAILLLWVVGIVLLVIRKKRTPEQVAAKIRKKKEKRDAKKQKMTVKHVKGLPLSDGVLCKITKEPELFRIEGSGMTYNLKETQVTSIDIVTENDVQEHYVSSTVGAIGGALLFGFVGGAIGGRAKKKRTVYTTSFVVFTYMSDEGGELRYICFELLGSSSRAWKWAEYYRTGVVRGAGGNVDL